MKTFLKIAVTSAALLTSINSFAASESQLLTQCKEFAKTQFNDIERIKSASIKSRKNRFEAKFKIRTAEDSGVYLCTIERGAEPSLARVDKTKAAQVAAKQ